MTFDQILADVRSKRDAAYNEYERHGAILTEMRARLDGPTPPSEAAVEAAVRDHATARAARQELEARMYELEAEKARDDAATTLAQRMSGRNDARTFSPTAPVGDTPTSQANVHGSPFVRNSDGRPAAVSRGQRFVEHDVVREHASRSADRDAAVIGQHGSLGSMVRAMTTTSGSAVVPTVWAGDIIDRARNLTAVLRAGAQVVPMDAKTVQIGRLTGDPTAAFRTEGSLITASDPTFDNVTLEAKTMAALVVGSLEWFQDADNVDDVVANAIAQAIAGNLDLVALYGSITSGAGSINLATPPNPRGILGTLNTVASTSVLGGVAGGTTQTATSFWNEVLGTVLTPGDYNETANALIWNSKAARLYAKAYDTTGQPLQVPPALSDVQQFVSNQIPSYTQGAMTNVATDIFAGDFTQLLIGQRLDLSIQTLTERYAENGQIGIVAHWRGDVGLARPRAFSVYKAIKGA
jgi:HK97 family phage major capsid protein